MKLIDYMDMTKTSRADMAAALSVSVECIRLWMCGERTPRPAQAEAIRALTKGAVTAVDFAQTAVQRQAERAA